MSARKAKKSVIVTGGTTRLGKVIAERLRKDGWRVLTTSHRPDSGADIIADLIPKDGADRLFAEAKRLMRGKFPDALVNNAALFKGNTDDLEALNVDAARLLIELMALRKKGRGAVVNILDARVRKDEYGLTKTMMRDTTTIAARCFAKTLRVNAVSPGPVLASKTVHEKAGECPLGRPTADDVAAAVSYLLSADTVTGVDIPVDGGARLACADLYGQRVVKS